jgi:hypothetical protein
MPTSRVRVGKKKEEMSGGEMPLKNGVPEGDPMAISHGTLSHHTAQVDWASPVCQALGWGLEAKVLESCSESDMDC